MPRLSTLVSTIRCFVFYNPGFQLERYYLIVPQLLHLAATILLSPHLLHLVSELPLGKAKEHPTIREYTVMLISHWNRYVECTL